MDWSQTICLLLLLIGSGAAICKDRWLIAVILWMNFAATITFNSNPNLVGIADILSGTILILYGDRRAAMVAGMYVLMIILYRFDDILGRGVVYTLVDVVGVAQLAISGGGGFGRLRHNLQFFIRDLFGVADRGSIGAGDHLQGGRRRDSGRAEKSLREK